MKLAIVTNNKSFVNSFKRNKSITIQQDYVFDLTTQGLERATDLAIAVDKFVVIYNSNVEIKEMKLLRYIQELTNNATSTLDVQELVILVKKDDSIATDTFKGTIATIQSKTNLSIRLEFYDEDSFGVYRRLIVGGDSVKEVEPQVFNRYVCKYNATSSTMKKDKSSGSLRVEETEEQKANKEYKKLDKGLAKSFKGKKINFKEKQNKFEDLENKKTNPPRIFKDAVGLNKNVIVTGMKYSGKTHSIMEMYHKLNKDGVETIIVNPTGRIYDYSDSNNNVAIEEVTDFSFLTTEGVEFKGNLINTLDKIYDPYFILNIQNKLLTQTIITEIDVEQVQDYINCSTNMKQSVLVISDKTNIMLRDTLEFIATLPVNVTLLINSNKFKDETKLEILRTYINIDFIYTVNEFIYKGVEDENDIVFE